MAGGMYHQFCCERIISIYNGLNNNELLMNLWVSCTVCAVWAKQLIVATLAPLPTASLEEGGRNRASWSRMASAASTRSLGTLSDGLFSPSRPVWTSSTGAAGFWERQWKFARLRTACHFCHFLLDRTSYKTRPNSREEKTDFPLEPSLIRMSCEVTLQRDMDERKNKDYAYFHNLPQGKWNRITLVSPCVLFLSM